MSRTVFGYTLKPSLKFDGIMFSCLNYDHDLGSLLYDLKQDTTIKPSTRRTMATATGLQAWLVKCFTQFHVIKTPPYHQVVCRKRNNSTVQVFSGSRDSSIRLHSFDMSKRSVLPRFVNAFEGHSDWISSMVLTSDAKSLVSSSADTVIRCNFD